MFKVTKNEKGFTLIELMIVVAIIGILAAVAIPNFLRYQAKSKQSEARVILSGIYTSETAYFAEQNSYGAYDLAMAGVGAARTATPGAGNAIDFAPAGVPKYLDTVVTAVHATGATFQTGSCGNIDNDAAVDSWTVDSTAREPINANNDVTDTGATACIAPVAPVP